jgi:O-antigen ligase
MLKYFQSLFDLSEYATTLLDKIRFILVLLFVVALPFDMLYSTLALLILIVTTILDFRIAKLQKIPKQVWIFQLVFLLSAFGYLYSTDKGDAAYLIQRQLAIFLFPIILPLAIKLEHKQVDVIVKALMLSCFLTVLYLFSVCFNVIITSRLPLNSLFTSRFFNHEFSGPVGIHAGYLSLYVSLSILYIIYRMSGALNVRAKLIYTIMLCILIAGLIFLESRNIIISTAIVIVFIFPLYQVKKKVPYLIISACILSLLIIVASQSPYIRDRFSSELLSDINVKNHSEKAFSEPRIKRWQCAVALIKKAPLWGYGTGDEMVALKPEYLKNNLVLSYQYNLDAHSTYLSDLLKHGFVGLFIIVGMFIYFLVLAIQGKDFLYTAFLIILLVGFFTENILDINKGIFYFGFFNTLFGYQILFERRYRLKAIAPTVNL